MDSISMDALLITENDWIATESVGFLATLALGLAMPLTVKTTIAVLDRIADRSTRNRKKLSKRSPGELQSEKVFNDTWVPEFNRFLTVVASDLNRADKQFGAKRYFHAVRHIGKRTADDNDAFVISVCDINAKFSDPDKDISPKKAQEIISLLEGKMKPYVNHWKTLAKRYEPYFHLGVEAERRSDESNSSFFDCMVVLRCSYVTVVDKYLGISFLKAGLPPFK